MGPSLRRVQVRGSADPVSYADWLCSLILAVGISMWASGLAHEDVKAVVTVIGGLGCMYGALRGEP